METIILDASTGKLLGVVTDPEMVDHVKGYPDDYIVWERFAISSRR